MTQSKRKQYINSLEEKKYNVSEAMEFIQGMANEGCAIVARGKYTDQQYCFQQLMLQPLPGKHLCYQRLFQYCSHFHQFVLLMILL